MKKIKVAFCLRDMQLGGVESVLIRTLDNLVLDKNLDISVVSFVDIHEPAFVDWFTKHPSVKRIVLYSSKYFGTRMPRFFLWRVIKHLCRDVYRFVLRITSVSHKLSGFDTLIDYHDFGFAKEFKKVRGAKKIAWFHSSLNVFVRRKFAKNLDDYDNVVVLTDDCANDLRQMYPQCRDKFIRVYNPIDIETIKIKSSEKCPLRGEYFCCVSRMSYDKDIRTLLNAFDLFWHTHKKVKLVIVGGGDKLDVFKQYASDLKSYKNISFVGAQKNPFVFMRCAIANVLSSYGEGLPTVLIESQVVGALNISADCKYGPHEILMSGRGGLLFMPGNAQQLAQCMADVYDKKVDIKQMILLSTRELKRFDYKTVCRQIKSLIS